MSARFAIGAAVALVGLAAISDAGSQNATSGGTRATPLEGMSRDTKMSVRGAVLYEGPSRIDGKPIIVVLTYTSTNDKTADMPQVWILAADVHPHEARVEGHDVRVCGGCIFAGNRGCYLNWFELKSIYNSYHKGNYGDLEHAAWWFRRNDPRTVRIGAYGDPVAVPLEVWNRLAAMPPGPTLLGYTQMWGSPLAKGYQRYCMASTKSLGERERARRLGWRSFRVALPQDAACAQEQISCPATVSDEQSCKGCRLCSGGASGVAGPDIVEPIHGNDRVLQKAVRQLERLKERERRQGAAGQDHRGSRSSWSPVVWHQTTSAGAEAIRRQGFSLAYPRARINDHGMPDGVFLKFHDQPIGVAQPDEVSVTGRPVQLRVKVDPGRVWRLRNRDDLAGVLDADREYRRLLNERRMVDVTWEREIKTLEAAQDARYKILWDAWRAAHPQDGRQRMASTTLADDPQLQELDRKVNEALAQWGHDSDEASSAVRARVTARVRALGYDSVLVERDEGSFGRVVRTLVVLDPKRVEIFP